MFCPVRRLKFLDIARGCTVALMLFVNHAGKVPGWIPHAPWNGLHLADLVMPSFLLIVGVSTALSLTASRQRGASPRVLLQRVLVRAGNHLLMPAPPFSMCEPLPCFLLMGVSIVLSLPASRQQGATPTVFLQSVLVRAGEYSLMPACPVLCLAILVTTQLRALSGALATHRPPHTGRCCHSFPITFDSSGASSACAKSHGTHRECSAVLDASGALS